MYFQLLKKGEEAYKTYSVNNLFHINEKTKKGVKIELKKFNLMKYVPSINKSVPVECVFQAGKVFQNGGPYFDILEKQPWEAKRDERLRTSGNLIAFEFEGKRYPLEPKTAFYDMIYIEALNENPELAAKVLEYDAFTDIEFNPDKSINCQAKACALFKAQSV